MTSFLRRIEGLITLVGASLGLLVLVVGVPLGLSLGIGFPGSLPTWGDIVNQLQIQGIPTPLVLYTLAFVCWLLWAYLMWSLLADAVTMARRSHEDRPAVARPGRWISGPLIASVVLGFHLLVSTEHAARPTSSAGDALAPRSVAAAVYVPERAPLDPSRGRAVLAGDTPSSGGATDQEVQVRPGDTLWGIAGREYRDPEDWPRIWEANRGQREDDGRIFTDPSLIQPGWELEVPGVPSAPATPTPQAPESPPTGEPSSSPTTSPANGGSAATRGVSASPGEEEIDVQPGDTLWSIAGRDLGNPTEWPEIWEANQGRVEPGGRAFTDPRLIYPGWELEVSPTETPAGAQPSAAGGSSGGAAPSSPAVSPRPAPSAAAPPAPSPAVVPTVPQPSAATPPVHRHPSPRRESPAVTEETNWLVILAEGGSVGLGLAAAVVAALAAVRRHERRRWRVEDGTRSRSRILALGPNVSLLRAALARRRVGRRSVQPDAADEDLAGGLVTALRRPDALPGTVPVGPRRDGDGDVVLGIEELSGLCLGGSGAVAVARAFAVSLLAHNPDAMADLVVLKGPDGSDLVLGLPEHSGVEVHEAAELLIAHFESEVARRQRSFAGREADGFRGAVGVDGALSALIAILPSRAVDALPDPARVAAVVSKGRHVGVGILCIGVPAFTHPELRPLMVGAHGSISPDPLSPLAATRWLYHLSRSEAGELLRTVAAGDGPDLVPEIPPDEEEAAAVAEPPPLPPAPPVPAADDPVRADGTAELKPVEVDIFGPVRVLVRGERVRLGIPNPGYEVLALLVVRGRGVTKEEGVDALGDGDASPQFCHRWDNGVRKTRRTLRGLVGGGADCIPCENGVYDLDRSLVDSDYWRLVSGVQAAHAVGDPHEKRVLLQEATRRIEGEPFTRVHFAWLGLEQEDVRRRGMLALAELAELQAAESDPDAAIGTLERALTLDPNPVEDLFRRMMLIQHRFGRDQAVRDSYAELRDRLRTRLETDPEEETEELMEAIKAGRPQLAE